MPYNNHFLNAVTFELSDARNYHERKVYGVLDLITEIGGFASAIFSLCAGLVTIIQFNG